MRSILSTVAVLLMLAVAAPAEARKPHRMTFEFAAMVATDYWTKRDVTVPCHPQALLLRRAETASWAGGYDPDMLANRAACTVDINPRADDYRYDPDTAWMYCMEITHEVGHLAGLEHEYGGVMDHEHNIVPWGCTHRHKFMRRWNAR